MLGFEVVDCTGRSKLLETLVIVFFHLYLPWKQSESTSESLISDADWVPCQPRSKKLNVIWSVTPSPNVVEDFRVGDIIPLAHVGGELKHCEERTPQVSCFLDMALAIWKTNRSRTRGS